MEGIGLEVDLEGWLKILPCPFPSTMALLFLSVWQGQKKFKGGKSISEFFDDIYA